MKRRTTAVRAAEAIKAGLVAGGAFAFSSCVVRSAARLGAFAPDREALEAVCSLIALVAPLFVAAKVGYHDDVPPSLRTMRHHLPNVRTGAEQIVGAAVGGAAFAIATVVASSVALRSAGRPAELLTLACLSSLFLGAGFGAVHALRLATRVGAPLTFALAASPALLFALSPRLLAACGSRHALSIVAREAHDRARIADDPSHAVTQRALSLSRRACELGDADACFRVAAAYDQGLSVRAHAGEAERFTRLGCDAHPDDLAPCERLLGAADPERSTAPCTVEARCPGDGALCDGSLASCSNEHGPKGRAAACARRVANGSWREVWCDPP